MDADGLCEVAVDLELVCAADFAWVPEASDEDEGDILELWVGFDFLCEVKAIHAWHLHIGEDDVWGGAERCHVEGFLKTGGSVGGFFDEEFPLLEAGAEDFAVDWVVVNDECLLIFEELGDVLGFGGKGEWVCDGEADVEKELGAFTGLGFDADLAVHHFDELFGDSQS